MVYMSLVTTSKGAKIWLTAHRSNGSQPQYLYLCNKPRQQNNKWENDRKKGVRSFGEDEETEGRYCTVKIFHFHFIQSYTFII